MRAVIRHLHSPDVLDLAAWTPSQESFEVLVQMMVGPADGAGEESFDVLVRNAQHVADRARHDGPTWEFEVYMEAR